MNAVADVRDAGDDFCDVASSVSNQLPLFSKTLDYIGLAEDEKSSRHSVVR